MTDVSIENYINEMISSYICLLQEELKERWALLELDMAELEKYEVIGALLARQVSLVTELARNPGIWNGHISPLILRSMVENHINLAWILINPQERSIDFIRYGVGQEKLIVEQLKESLKEQGIPDSGEDFQITALESWINSQRYTFLTTVNVGHWAEKNVRTMADESGCMDLYRYAYTPFSAAVHSQWNHVAKYNLSVCSNPLHQYHKIPISSASSPDPDYFYRAAKYMNKSFRLIDEKFEIKLSSDSAFSKLIADFEKVAEFTNDNSFEE